MRKPEKLLALLLSALLALALPGCAAPAEKAPAEEIAAETPVRAEGQPGLALERDAGLEPYACTSSVNRLILSLLYEPLFRVSAEFAAEPVLAESWSVSEDGRTTTVLLCEDETVSDASRVAHAAKLFSDLFEQRLPFRGQISSDLISVDHCKALFFKII